MHRYTQEAYDDLLGSIKKCKTSLKEAKLRMGESAQADTWHDNAAFDQAKEDVRNLEIQLQQLTRIRNEAVVVEAARSGVIEVGSVVIVQYGDGDQEKVMVDGRSGQTAHGEDREIMRISTASPMGAALLGHTTGDSVTYPVPNGNTITLSVVEVA